MSPTKAEYFLPSKVKLIFLCDVIGWLGILLGFVFIITYFTDFISAWELRRQLFLKAFLPSGDLGRDPAG